VPLHYRIVPPSVPASAATTEGLFTQTLPFLDSHVRRWMLSCSNFNIVQVIAQPLHLTKL
jgi:hypothetical protein